MTYTVLSGTLNSSIPCHIQFFTKRRFGSWTVSLRHVFPVHAGWSVLRLFRRRILPAAVDRTDTTKRIFISPEPVVSLCSAMYCSAICYAAYVKLLGSRNGQRCVKFQILFVRQGGRPQKDLLVVHCFYV